MIERWAQEFFHWFVFTWVLATICLAQQAAIQPKSGSWTSRDMKLYNAGKQEQLSGHVLSIEEGNGSDVERTLKFTLSTDKGDFVVDVGPRWFLLNNSFNITEGEPMTVAGITVRFQGKSQIEANELRSGSQHVVLRNLAGKPVWEPEQH